MLWNWESYKLCHVLSVSYVLFGFYMVADSRFSFSIWSSPLYFCVEIFFEICRYADEPSIMRYIKIAATMREKTVRDVALRCRWMLVSSSHTEMVSFGYLMLCYNL